MSVAFEPIPFELATTDPDEFTEAVQTIAAGACVGGIHRRAFDAQLKGFPLSHLGLMLIRCRNLRAHHESARAYTGVTMALTRSFEIHGHGAGHYLPGSAHLLASDVGFDLRGDDSVVLVANINTDYLSDLGVKLNGRKEAFAPRFAHRVALGSRHGGIFWRTVSDLWRAMNRPGGAIPYPMMLREQEADVATQLLLADDSIRTAMALGSESIKHSRHLRRAEEWIVANLDRAISRADICDVAELDLRTVSRAFRQRHGIGPMAFVRARRLDAVNRCLLGLERGHGTVTDVAMTSGFHHLSRFAADYRRAFGELPSDTLKR